MASTSAASAPVVPVPRDADPHLSRISLFVRPIASTVTEQSLAQHFQTAGAVTNVRIVRDVTTGMPMNAYVNFVSHDEAQKAFEDLSGSKLEGKFLSVQWSIRVPTERPGSDCSVFIKGVAPQLTERDLIGLATSQEDLTPLHCTVRRSPEGESKGSATMQFASGEQAARFIRRFNGLEVEGSDLECAPYVPPNQRQQQYTNVYVKGLPRSWHTDDLRAVFETFGDISSCQVARDAAGESRGFGFLNFDDAEAATRCVAEMDGKQVDETFEGEAAVEQRRVDLRRYHRRLAKARRAAAVAALQEEGGEAAAAGTEPGDVPAESLEAFEERMAALDPTTEEGPEVVVGTMLVLAVPPISAEGKYVRKRTLQVHRAQKKEERQRSIRANMRTRRQYTPNTNLYVKNLAPTVTDDDLRELFSRHGTITSLRIVKDDDGTSKGFGYVSFTTAEEASTAIGETHRTMLAGKPLYVTLWQSRAVRLAEQAKRHREQQARRAQAAAAQAAPMPMPGAPMAAAGQAPAQPRQMMLSQEQMLQMMLQMQAQLQMYQQQAMAMGLPPPGHAAPQHQQQPQPASMATAPAAAAQQPSVGPVPELRQIGEVLYTRILPMLGNNAALCGKVVGMLLEGVEQTDLMMLVDDPARLQEKVQEAIAVLSEQQRA